MVVRNVAELVEIPTAEQPKTRALQVHEARQLLNAVQGERLEALYWVALLLGLRRGEILGLRWEDVNLEQRTLQVTGAVSRQKQEDGKSKIVFTPTKTTAGVRLLPLPDILCTVPAAHQARQNDERTTLGWQEHGLVFPSEKGTPLEAQNVINRSFKPALERAGIPDLRFHDLRHSCASLLIALGVDPKTVSAILGHTSTAFTLTTYSHALPEITCQAVTELGSLLIDTDRVLALPVKVRRTR